MNAKIKGYTLGAIAAATYGMNPLFALPLYSDGMDADSVLFFRYLFAIPILGIMIKARGRSFRLNRREILPLVALGLLVAASSLTLFLSYNYMDAGIASTILFVYPIMVALIMAMVFKEKITLQTAFCILLALAGIGMLYQGGDGATLSLAGTLFVLASALTYAIYIVGINQSSLKNVATLKVTFYILLFGVSLFLVRLDFGQAVTLPQKWYRLYSYRYSRSVGTSNRCHNRRHSVRRSIDTANTVRNTDDYSRRNTDNSRRTHNPTPRPLPQNVPAAAP